MTKPLKIIALEWNVPMHIDMLALLEKRHGWQTVYCVSKDTQELVKRHLPDAIYHDTHEARYGRPASELVEMPPMVIDQPTVEALGYAQVVALKQMGRMEIFGGFPLQDRIIHFNQLVGYWSAVLDRLKPDLLLMPTAPHVVYDYVAYQLAKLRGIRAVMFEFVTTEGMLMAIDRYDDGLPPLTAAYQRLLANPPSGPFVLCDHLEKDLVRLAGTYDQAMPSWTKELLQQAEATRLAELEAKKKSEADAQRLIDEATANQPHPVLQRIRSAWAALRASDPAPLVEPASSQALPRPPSTDGYYRGKFYSAAEVPEDLARSSAEYRRQHIETATRYYDELAVTPDLSQPYVYVALHLQPERSTNPIGGIFDDQDVLIGLIASTLPAGWRIYVKEHPSQFLPQFVSERGRWTTFYDAVLAHPGVSFVSRKTPSFNLIDHARAVATVTGTSSWEAIVRGIPTLVFGEAWYKGCDGAYTVRTAEDCRRALMRIDAGERPRREAVRLFLRAAEETSFVGYLTSSEPVAATLDEATNVDRLTRAIAECYDAGLKKT